MYGAILVNDNVDNISDHGKTYQVSVNLVHVEMKVQPHHADATAEEAAIRR